ncbi:ABC transporter ATP-binding protein [Phytoactinopolyspora alkaliphila]|uniref:ABC transporter ATP-binding protein n=1 Tax=Phytoactinopolyspora alkaliphila TaxID=1783498 RepID=A0A6N9YTR2_9ACTN|nr:ABC transporter ATP-binding protein [Phytoactinopolyspora alkaliphila]NED98354.1 ABC transporter ATP-binding protein [Phytoactinopolyspora alkaliphila]
MTLGIDVRNLTVRFGDVVAVDDVSFTLSGGKIYGLLGRNGSGKTTLLSLLAAFAPVRQGKVLVGGAEPFENSAVTEKVCLIRERSIAPDGTTVKDILNDARVFRPAWDEKYADRLLDMFQLPRKKTVSRLSRGQQSALGITVGLASRASVTIFDESYLGLDAPTRYDFYDELLRDYMEQPRTIIMSSHLIEEVGRLFEEVLILDRGRLVSHEETDTLLTAGAAVTGPAHLVDEVTQGLTVLSQQQLGGTKSTAVYGKISEDAQARARSAGLEIGSLGLQDLFVHLTREREEPT